MAEQHKKEMEKQKSVYEEVIGGMKGEKDELESQLTQVEEKFRMLRVETEQSAKSKKVSEIPPAVQVELVDLSKQVRS